MRVRLKDVAEAAGVSIGTASMVLRKDPHPWISAATRERVQGIAGQMGYRHDLNARSLRSGKSQSIGVVVRSLALRITLTKTEAVDRAIRQRGYRSLLRNAGGRFELQSEFIEEFVGAHVDGVVFAYPARLTPEMLAPLTQHQIPIVSLELQAGVALDCVVVDHRHGAHQAAGHLLALGHRRIAMLPGNLVSPNNLQRVEGYREALAESGLPFDESLVLQTREGYAGGYEAGKAVLDLVPRPTAALCNNDEMAIGVTKAAEDLGIRVPDDLALIGYDDIEAAQYAPVRLTTVAQPSEEMASRAVDLLFQRMADPDCLPHPQTIRLKPQLVIRESCGAARKETHAQFTSPKEFSINNQ